MQRTKRRGSPAEAWQVLAASAVVQLSWASNPTRQVEAWLLEYAIGGVEAEEMVLFALDASVSRETLLRFDREEGWRGEGQCVGGGGSFDGRRRPADGIALRSPGFTQIQATRADPDMITRVRRADGSGY